jgi:hypothetical protein
MTLELLQDQYFSISGKHLDVSSEDEFYKTIDPEIVHPYFFSIVKEAYNLTDINVSSEQIKPSVSVAIFCYIQFLNALRMYDLKYEHRCVEMCEYINTIIDYNFLAENDSRLDKINGIFAPKTDAIIRKFKNTIKKYTESDIKHTINNLYKKLISKYPFLVCINSANIILPTLSYCLNNHIDVLGYTACQAVEFQILSEIDKNNLLYITVFINLINNLVKSLASPYFSDKSPEQDEYDQNANPSYLLTITEDMNVYSRIINELNILSSI